MILTRRTALLGALATAPALAASVAQARESTVFQTDGVAINGADPVAYFTQERPVRGSFDHTFDWNGARWHFASAANRDSFATSPERYAPRFGGYCAYAASLGYLAPTLPEAWTVYEDVLYLNANLRARALWLEDVPGNIAKGEANWPGILG